MFYALLLPGLSLYFNRRKILGLVMLLLQVTIIGWIVGAFIAVPNLKRQRRMAGLNENAWGPAAHFNQLPATPR